LDPLVGWVGGSLTGGRWGGGWHRAAGGGCCVVWVGWCAGGVRGWLGGGCAIILPAAYAV